MRGAPAYGPLAAECGLDGHQLVEQRARRQRRLADDDGVEIERLIFEALPFGLRLDDLGERGIGEDSGESIGGKGDRCASIAEVAADGDDGRRSMSNWWIGELSEFVTAELPIHRFTNSPIRQLLDPPRRQDVALRAGAVGAAAEDVGPAGERLFEHALVLEGLAEDHAQQRAVTGVRQRVDAGAPLLDERCAPCRGRSSGWPF